LVLGETRFSRVSSSRIGLLLSFPISEANLPKEGIQTLTANIVPLSGLFQTLLTMPGGSLLSFNTL